MNTMRKTIVSTMRGIMDTNIMRSFDVVSVRDGHEGCRCGGAHGVLIYVYSWRSGPQGIRWERLHEIA